MVLCAFNPSTQKAEAGRPLSVQGQPNLPHSEFLASWSYIELLCQKRKEDKKNQETV